MRVTAIVMAPDGSLSLSGRDCQGRYEVPGRRGRFGNLLRPLGATNARPWVTELRAGSDRSMSALIAADSVGRCYPGQLLSQLEFGSRAIAESIPAWCARASTTSRRHAPQTWSRKRLEFPLTRFGPTCSLPTRARRCPEPPPHADGCPWPDIADGPSPGVVSLAGHWSHIVVNRPVEPASNDR